MSCAPLFFVVCGGAKPAVEVSSITGAGAPLTARFQVWGFDPRLRVLVRFYFRRADNTGNLLGVNNWSAVALARDSSGRQVNLAPVFTSRDLMSGAPSSGGDSWEFQSGVEGVEFAATLDYPGILGSWVAEVIARPAVGGLCDQAIGDLYRGLSLVLPTPTTRIPISST